MVSARLRAPPYSLGCRETRLHSSENRLEMPQFRDSRLETGLEKVSREFRRRGFAAIFSGGRMCSPVSTSPLGECNAITNRSFGECDLTSMAGRAAPPAAGEGF